MAALGDANSAWVELCWLAACTFMRSWQDFDLFTPIQLPLFLFSATFLPISLYPHWLGAIISLSPLYQSAASLRGLALGRFHWIMVMRVANLLTLAMVGLWFAAKRFHQILVP
jgi:lipooligosaccharide transport system permease protein